MSFDVVIVGGGLVGRTLALALAQTTDLSVAILEANAISVEDTITKKYQPRVSAINLASQRLFKRLGIWKAIENIRISPLKQIDVWDAVTKKNIHFDAQMIAEPVLGHIIENEVILMALKQKLAQYSHVKWFAPVKLKSYQLTNDSVTISTTTHVINAKLAVAADGAASWLRTQVGISTKEYDYEQRAIVCMVKTQRSHEKVARQVFLPEGPLAFLPLAQPDLSSIVWSQPVEMANRLQQMTEEEFKSKLNAVFENRLGNIIEVGQRYAFPLKRLNAQQYIAKRSALVGDAAHTVHPLAGQGVNIGLMDAASLAELLAQACRNQQDIANDLLLKRYQRWRKNANFPLLYGIDGIKNIFAMKTPLVKTTRAWGMQLSNRFNFIKNIIMKEAIGDRLDLPQLAKKINGEM